MCPSPVLEPADAIVRVTRTAICGSDLHFLHGKAPMEPGDRWATRPSGSWRRSATASSAAPGRSRRRRVQHRVRDVLVLPPRAVPALRGLGDPRLRDLRRGAPRRAGGAGPGTERRREPAAGPGRGDDDAAVFVGDVLTTGFYGASLAAPDPRRRRGARLGPVGLLTVQACARWGCAPSSRSTGSPTARARRGGRCQPVHIDERNPQTAVEGTDGRGADVVIDAVGHPAAFETAIDIVRRGGASWCSGCTPARPWSCSSARTGHGRSTCGSRGSGRSSRGGSGRWPRCRRATGPAPLISHRLPLEDAARGYALFDRREATKVVLEP